MSNISNIRHFNRKLDQVELLITQQIGVGFKPHECVTTQLFAPGIFVQKIFIPKGNILTGKIHKTEHIVDMNLGIIQLYDFEHPEGVMVISPYTAVSKPGARRLAIALEDTQWLEIHANPDNCRDLAILESRIIQNYTNKLLNLPLKQTA